MALTLTVPIIDLYFDDDGIRTETSQAQEVVEGNVEAVFEVPRKTANYRQQCVTRILNLWSTNQAAKFWNKRI
jgi:hypothetical protein